MLRKCLVGLFALVAMVAMAGCGRAAYGVETTLADRDLVGYEVRDAAAERAGEVASVVVDLESGEISYLVVRRPTIPHSYADNVSAHLIPVPWRIVELDEQAHVLRLSVSRELLRAAPRFAALPNTRVDNWDQAVRAYWDEIGE